MDDTPDIGDTDSPENLVIPAEATPPEGEDVTPSDREAFFAARFKNPDTADRRGEHLIAQAETAYHNAHNSR